MGSILAGCASPLRGVATNEALPGVTLVSAANHAAISRHRRAKLTIRIRVPRRRSHFISSGTKGIAFALSGEASRNFVFSLTPSSPNCHVVNTENVCTMVLSLFAGSYAMTAMTYDQPPSGGVIPKSANVLATANMSVNVAVGKINNFHLTLDGVPASLSITGMPSGSAGTAFVAAQPLTVTAKDSSGDVIVGTYENVVSITDSDTSGATSIVTSPSAGKLSSSSDTVKLNYTGLSIAPATIGAHATGATAGTATFTPVLAPIVFGSIDTMNPSFVGIDLYATSGIGSSAGFTASEVGWTNAPYNKEIGATGDSNCASFASVTPSAGTSFTATVAGTPSGASSCALTLGGGGQSLQVALYYSSYTYTGAEQTLNVPAHVTQMSVTAAGAAGGAGFSGISSGGLGGSATATVPVTPLETLALYVGGVGGEGEANPSGTTVVTPGYNGGGNPGPSLTIGGAGGGGSDVREGGTALANRIIVGGGGGGGASPGGDGGTGGNPGGAGGNGPGTSTGGYGGDNMLGGGPPGMDSGCNSTATAGSLGQGGGSGSACHNGGGAGGGGYYGGGMGGGWTSGSTPGAGGGGGGSSFAEVSATNTSFTTGTQSADGVVVLIF
jgi:hypothetical protein